MVEFFSTLAEKAPELVKTPLGLFGLCVLVGAYLLAFWKKARFDSLIARIEALPKADRLQALQSEMGSVPLPANFAPADWLMAQRQKYLLRRLFHHRATRRDADRVHDFLCRSGTTTINIDGDGNSAVVGSEVSTGN